MKYLNDGRWQCECGQIIDYSPIPISPDPDGPSCCYECLSDDDKDAYDAVFCPEIQIQKGNARRRIEDAIHTILNCWDDWDAFAQNEAQVEQDSDTWHYSMVAQLEAVIAGMVFDPPIKKEGETSDE